MDLSRRRFLGLAGASAIAGAGISGGVIKVADASTPSLDDAVPFDGTHQAGITTPSQDRVHFAAFDLITDDRDDVIAMLQQWTAAARRMAAGKDAGTIGAVDGSPEAPPDDTGEALGLSPSQLTLTIGFGPTFFSKDGVDRFGVGNKRPAALVDLPAFSGEDLDLNRSHGDIAVQACANDPQVAVHAIRNLVRLAHGTAAVRWSQLGFGRTSTTSTAQSTPRNLFGFKDGTANLKLEQKEKLRDWVWAQDDDGADWMQGGTYMVARRIRMQIETWDRARLSEQERVVGRSKGEGAPLTGSKESDQPDFGVKANGEYVIDKQSHVRLAHPETNNGAELLRRGFSFTDGSDGLGHLDAGLFFICFQRDPRTQFIPIQRQLANNDAMNEYVKHNGSGIWACPPGTTKDSYWGQGLFT